jgi:hypothetical protein
LKNSSSRLGPIALCLISSGAVAVHSASHLPFISDDALISLRYARRLLQGHGLTWTDGPAVEGYSNLLWTLLAAALGGLGLDLIDAVRILGWIGMGSVPVVVAVWIGWVDAPRERGVGLAMGMLAWGFAAPVAVWAVGGLEQPLVAALLVLAIPLCYRVAEADPPRASVVLATSTLLGLLCLARLDGPLFSVAALVAVGLVRRRQGHRGPRSADLLLLAVPLLCVLGQGVFRWTYYGELIPNTALVKIVPSAYHTAVGVYYVARGLIALFPWPVVGVLCLLALLGSARRWPRGVVLSTFLLLWLAYLMVVGGDVFPAHRHLVPVCVLLLFAVVDGAGPLLRGVRRRFGSSRIAAPAPSDGSGTCRCSGCCSGKRSPTSSPCWRSRPQGGCPTGRSCLAWTCWGSTITTCPATDPPTWAAAIRATSWGTEAMSSAAAPTSSASMPACGSRSSAAASRCSGARSSPRPTPR